MAAAESPRIGWVFGGFWVLGCCPLFGGFLDFCGGLIAAARQGAEQSAEKKEIRSREFKFLAGGFKVIKKNTTKKVGKLLQKKSPIKKITTKRIFDKKLLQKKITNITKKVITKKVITKKISDKKNYYKKNTCHKTGILI